MTAPTTNVPTFDTLHPHWQGELQRAHAQIRALNHQYQHGDVPLDQLPKDWQRKIKRLRRDSASFRSRLRELELAVAQADNGAVAARLAELQADN